MLYEILLYDGWSSSPAYILLDGVEGETPDGALRDNIDGLIQKVRDRFCLSHDEVSDVRIRETLYLLKPDGLICARNS